MKLLFVCLGNICRSPSAEAVMASTLKIKGIEGIEVDSAGTAAYHIGNPPDPRSQSAAKARGIEMSHLRARQVSTSDFLEFDYILAMDAQNLQDLLDVKPNGSKAKVELFLDQYGTTNVKEVPDPYYGGEAGFEFVLDLLEDACQHFVEREGLGK